MSGSWVANFQMVRANRQMVKKIIASILICIAIGVALHQILVYGGWEWNEMLSLIHHEGVAAASALAGLLLYFLPSKKR